MANPGKSEITSREIEYEADGITMIGHLAVPAGDVVRPGILIGHEGGGLVDYERERADDLARLGYVAFALDYLGGGAPLTDRDEMMTRLGALTADPDRFRAVGRAGLDVLTAQPQTDRTRLAGIGYCAGGTLMLELARAGTDLAAVVGFHSGLGTAHPDQAHNITGAVLVCIGSEDPFITAETRLAFENEMRAGDVDWRMNVYGAAVHSFTHPRSEPSPMAGIAYHQPSDERSWRAMLDLLTEVFPETG